MASQSLRFVRQGSWSALAALVVATLAAPVVQAPVSAKASAHAAVPGINHAAPVAAAHGSVTQDVLHGPYP